MAGGSADSRSCNTGGVPFSRRQDTVLVPIARSTLSKVACLIRGFWPLSAWFLVMIYDAISEQLICKVELSGTTAFRASDAFASDDICGEASIIDFAHTTASSAGNVLDDG
jgi:hypothetical protein